MADQPNNLDTAFNQMAADVPSQDEALSQAFDTPAAVPSPAQRAPAEMPTAGQANVVNPEGKLVSVPSDQLQAAIASGYRPATAQDIDLHVKHEKYGSTGQQLVTGLEGAAEGATFGLSTGAERALGIKAEDIRNRREENPGSHMLGEAAGLVGSALVPGVGEANLLHAAGMGATKAIGLGAAEGALAKIGSGIVKNAVETALVTGGDEVSKALSSDPNQTAQSVISNIGLGTLLGGGIGGAMSGTGVLWDVAKGSKLAQSLKGLTDKLGGAEGVVPDAIHDATEASGMKIAPEIKAAMSSDPHIQTMANTLFESNSRSGVKALEALKSFKNQTGEAIAAALGKTPEEIANLSSLSEHEAGNSLKNQLVSDLKTQIDPISEQFETVKSRFKDMPLAADSMVETPTFMGGVERTTQPGVTSQIADKLSQLAEEKGWSRSPSSPEMKMINRITEELPLQKSLNDLRNFQSIVADDAQRQQLWHLGSQVRGIFRDMEDQVVTKALGEQAPELLEQHALARSAYKSAMNTIEDLNDRLHVGRYSGPGNFIRNLQDMAPEDVLRRLSPKGDAGIIESLSSKFPNVATGLRDFHLSQLLKNAASKVGPDEVLNPKVFFNGVDKMSPEMRGFLVNPDASHKLDAIKTLLDALPARMNPSGTAKTLDSLWSQLPASAMSVISGLTGHNPAIGYVTGHLMKMLGRDVPDAIKLATLKFLGEGKPIQAGAFKQSVDYIQHAIEAERMTSKAVKGIFKAGSQVFPQFLEPSESTRKKLDKQVQSLQKDPTPLFSTAGDTSYYLPKHGEALSQSASNIVNYLAAQRPSEVRPSPLDKPIPPSKAQMQAYNRTLDIAQQPLTVMGHIQAGTLTSKDVIDLKAMYPSLYAQYSQKLMNQVMDASEKERDIPYKTRLGLSLFVGQALDSTMQPANIMAAQPVSKNGPQQSDSGTNGQPGQRPKHSMTALNKLAPSYQTATQAAEASNLKTT